MLNKHETKNVILIGQDESEFESSKNKLGEQVNYIFYPECKIGRKRKGYNELREYVVQTDIDTVVTRKEYVDIASKLLWHCDCVLRYYLIDASDPFLAEENDAHIQARLWNSIALSDFTDDPIKQSGWKSSFTGEYFTDEEIEEYVANTKIKLSPFLDKTKTVLEIGIASGLTATSIAPLVKKYIGVDISEQTLEKTARRFKYQGIDNVNLALCEAIDIDKVVSRGIDIVIINSVAQYFPGFNYVIKLIDKLVKMIPTNGTIFLGDVLDYTKRTEFEEELIQAGGVGANQRDMWYPRSFFEELPSLVSGLADVKITEKIGRLDTELRNYRYDVIVQVDHKCTDLIRYSKKNAYIL